MRLNQSGGNFQVGLHKTAIKLDRGATRRVPEIHVCRIVPGKMIGDPHGLEHPRITHQFFEFGTFVGAMQSCGHQDGDVLWRHAGVKQLPDDLRKQQAIGHRAGDIADQDAGRAQAGGFFRQKTGLHRSGQCRAHGLRWIGFHRHRRLANHRDVPVVGKVQRKSVASIIQFKSHGLDRDRRLNKL